MAQNYKQILTDYVNSHIYSPANNTITGNIHNTALINLIDSVVWYNERRTEKIFPEHVSGLYTSFNSGLSVRTIGILNADLSSNPAVSAQQDDIFIVDSPGPIWNPHPDWNRDKDWIVYDSTNKVLRIYDHRKDVGSKWTEIGVPFHINHNQTNTLQGGNQSLDQFYHLDEEAYNFILSIVNSYIVNPAIYSERILSSSSDISYIIANDQYFLVPETSQAGEQIRYGLYVSSGYPTTPTLTLDSTYVDKNYVILDKDSQKLFMYSLVENKWINLGYYIDKIHNHLLGLQGGLPGEYNHLTNAQLGKLDALYNYYLFNLSYTVKNVLPNTLDTSYITANGQYFLVGSGQEYDLYVSMGYPNSPSYSLINFTSDIKSYLVYALDTKKQYFWNHETGKFIDAGKFIAFNHNHAQNLQGGSPGEYYHITESQYNNLSNILIPLVYSETLYVDSSNGDDVNGDGSEINPYRTLYGALKESKGLNLTFILKDGAVSYYVDDDFVHELQKRTIRSIKFLNYSDVPSGTDMVTINGVSSFIGSYDATYSGNIRQGEYYIIKGEEKFMLKSYETIYNTSGLNSNVLVLQKEDTFSTDPYQIYIIDKKIKFNATLNTYLPNLDISFDNIYVTGNNNIFDYLKNTRVSFKDSYIYLSNLADDNDGFPIECSFDNCVNKLGAVIFKNTVSYSSLYFITTKLEIKTSSFYGDDIAFDGGYIKGHDNNSRLYVKGNLLMGGGAYFDITNPLGVYVEENSKQIYFSQKGSSDVYIFRGFEAHVSDIDFVLLRDKIDFSNASKFYLTDIINYINFPYSEKNNINVIFANNLLNLYKQVEEFNFIIPAGAVIDVKLFKTSFLNSCFLDISTEQYDSANAVQTSKIENNVVINNGGTIESTAITKQTNTLPQMSISYSISNNIAIASITNNSATDDLYISGIIRRNAIRNYHSLPISDMIY